MEENQEEIKPIPKKENIIPGLEDFRQQVDKIVNEKIQRMVSAVDQSVLRKHYQRMSGTNQEQLSAVELHNQILKDQQSKMVEDAQKKASLQAGYMKTKKMHEFKQQKRFQVSSVRKEINANKMTIDEGNTILMAQAQKEKCKMMEAVVGRKNEYEKGIKNMIIKISKSSQILNQQYELCQNLT